MDIKVTLGKKWKLVLYLSHASHMMNVTKNHDYLQLKNICFTTYTINKESSIYESTQMAKGPCNSGCKWTWDRWSKRDMCN